MNNIATSVEQSKKLLAIGIDYHTASAHWWDGRIVNWRIANLDVMPRDIPAWTLCDLIEILPNKIAVEGLEFSLELTKDEIGYIRREGSIRRHKGYIFIGDDSDSTLIDIAVKAIVTLKKEGII